MKLFHQVRIKIFKLSSQKTFQLQSKNMSPVLSGQKYQLLKNVTVKGIIEALRGNFYQY